MLRSLALGIILEEFDPIHPPDTLDKYLPRDKHLGPVDMSTVTKEIKTEDPDEEDRQERIKNKPSLESCFNLLDFEAVAKSVMKKQAWAYYSSYVEFNKYPFI
jgi:L-lactate dehydrogenase (cytochrome)